MPSTRRRFLSGAAAGVALLAGCNDRASDGNRGTVTPVDVPMTDSQLLEQAASIEYPSLPPAVVVTDTHFEDAIGHVESLVDELEHELDEADEVDFSDLRRPAPGRSSRSGGTHVVQETRDRLDSIRERAPSLEPLSDVERALRDVSHLLGFVRAETGEITLDEIERTVDDERESARELRADIGYRLASPVAATLPTLQAAEEKLDSTPEQKHALETGDGDETVDSASRRVADLRRVLARHRRRRRDAERFLETATEPGARSFRTSVDRELEAVQDELESLPDRFQTPEGRRDQGTLVEELRGNRRHVGRRSSAWLQAYETYRTDGRRVLGLLRGYRILVEADAVDAAVMRTTERLDGRTFPAETVPDEKRRAVERIESLVDGPAVQRALAERAVSILDFGRHQRGDDGVTVETVARTFFLYAVAAEWAASSAERGRTLVESLRSDQS